MSEQRVKVGVVGASGYSGEELLNILLRHPHVELTVVTSRQYAGQQVGEVFPRFSHYPGTAGLTFCDPDPEKFGAQAECFFLALPHGVAHEYAKSLVGQGKRIIDLSADFRLDDPAIYKEFYGHEHPCPELLSQSVYGLPEIHGPSIREAQLIASPGCYPTSILVPLMPLVEQSVIRPDSIIADSLSGVSGAGRNASLPYLYVECNESLRPYGVPKHRHLAEIEQELSKAAERQITIQFTPHLVPVNRGILTTIYAAPASEIRSTESMEAFNQRLESIYQEYYGECPFVRLLGTGALPDTKNVTGTNVIEFGWRLDPRTGRLIVMSAEDNLIKGAGGQAVQSMNLIYGFRETDGLI